MAVLLVPALAQAADFSVGFGAPAAAFSALRTGLSFTPVANSGPTPQDLTVSPFKRLSSATDSSGNVTATYGDVTTSGDNTPGITVTSTGATTITAGDVTTSGANSGGIVANAGGAISINAGNISTNGKASDGVYAYSSGGGAISITTGAVSTANGAPTGRSHGIYAKSAGNAGDVSIVANGDVSATDGISNGVTAFGDNVAVTAGNVSGRIGVYGYGAGTVDLTVTGSINASATNAGRLLLAAAGIWGVSETGSVAINSSGPISSSTASGFAVGSGIVGIAHYDSNVTVNSAGAITVSGGASERGIYASVVSTYYGTGNGSVTVNSKSVTLDQEGVGIAVLTPRYGSGSVTITSGDISLNGKYSTGIAVSAGGNVDITSTGAISGAKASVGVSALSYSGSVAIHNEGSITLGGFVSAGISAMASGNVTIDGGGSVNTGNYSAIGIGAISKDGSITVNQGNVLAGTYGVLAFAEANGQQGSGASGVNITVGDVTTTRAGEPFNGVITSGGAGIVAVDYAHGGAITINANSVQTSGDYAQGIRTGSVAGGSVTITGGSVLTRGNRAAGLFLYQADNVNVTLNSVATTGSYRSPGVEISTSGTGNINVNVGSVATSGYVSPGITLYSRGSAAVTAGNITTAGKYADAVYAITGAGLTINTGSIATVGDGAWGVVGKSGGAINIAAGSIATTGTQALGIYAFGEAGVTINAGSISTTGDGSAAIVAKSNSGLMSITETGGITTTGDTAASGARAYGIIAVNFGGGIDLDLSGAIHASSVAVYAKDGYAPINLTANSVSGSGGGIPVIQLTSLYGSVNAAVGSVTSTGGKAPALFASGQTGVDITAGQISTSAENSTGLVARSGGYGVIGDANINVTAITTSGEQSSGIDAITVGQLNGQASKLSIAAGTITTSGNFTAGITAQDFYGTLNIQAQNITASGTRSYGILAVGGSEINIQAGAISSTSTAIYAASNNAGIGGTFSFAVTGKVASSAGSGIVSVNPSDPTTVTVSSGGGISGALDGVQVQTTTGQVNIANAGAISGGTGYAIDVVGVKDPATGVVSTPTSGAVIDNTGVISGGVYLAAANNLLSNEGVFNAGKASVFGAGSSFVNTGTVNVSGQVAFQGLSSFQNSGGLVDLRGGPAGTTFTLAGNYVASGNARLGLGVGDELVVQGQASGATQILLGASPATATMFAARPLVQMGAGSTATFTLANADVGLVHYSLTQGAGASSGTSNGPVAAAAGPTTYSLSASAGQPVYATLKLEESGQTAWRQSADAWSAHLAAMRGDAWGADSASGSGSGSGRIWAQVYRSTSDRDGHADASYGQVSTAYEQTDVGVQIGGDLMRRTTGLGQVVWGLTGGYDNSSINGKDNISQSNFDTLNVGGYASLFSAHGVFANALVKYDHNQISTSNAAAGYSVDLTGNSVGFQVELGQRFGDDRFDFEPLVSLNYVHTSLDNVEILNQSLAFNDDDGLSAKFGGRVSTRRWVGSTATVLYAGASVVDDFSGAEKASFTSGGMVQDVSAKGTGVYGQGVIGVSAHTSFGLSLYAEGHGEFGGDDNGSGFRIGGRFNF